MRLYRWALSWIETWRIAPPFSKRRRELLATLREIDYYDPDDWVEVERP